MPYLLGIDTGGTYTDAVLVDETLRMLASAKTLTSKHDLALGIGAALETVLAAADEPVGMVSLSTTLATNALVEGAGAPICLLLLGYPADTLERAGLGEALGGDPVVFIAGGHDAAGAEQAPLDATAVRESVERYAGRVSAFAISAYFAVRNPAHELQVRDLVREFSGLPVSCGHQLSSALDAPRRALTAALNARLIFLLDRLISAVRDKLLELGVRAPLMVVKGDGSLISAEAALAGPVETILSGPAASVVGARHLAGMGELIVADMGGTTTDIAVLEQGRPVLNRDGALVGGWRTMVEAVQVHTFGLGGDSEVRLDAGGEFAIGPRRLIPLSLLAVDYPAVMPVLQQQLEEPPGRHDARFALRLGSAPGSLSYAQNKLWTALANGPAPLRALLADPALELPLERLVTRGMVALAGFTPSDAAHVLGEQRDWSLQAARVGARLLQRRVEPQMGPRWPDEQVFCRQVVEAVVLQAGRNLVASVLAERSAVLGQGLSALQQDFVDAALGSGSASALLGVELSLRRPLVAIGAPVGLYYPRVVERLRARLCIPEHAAVANALGAVAGGVVQHAIAHITPIGECVFRVHAPGGVSDFTSLEAAAAYALQETAQLARERAQRVGAIEVQVQTRRKDNTVRDAGGLEVFFESQITATAYGRPRVAAR